MKNCTDLKQSKRLVEFLPIESADMHYSTWTILDGEFIVSPNYGQTIESMQEDYGNQIIPCWSLAALLEILPKNYGRYTKSLYWFDDCWHCEYVDQDGEGRAGETADNPVDAIFKMILKFKRANLI